MLIMGKQSYRQEGDTVAVLTKRRVGLLLLLLALCIFFWLGSVWVRVYDRPPAEDLPPADGTITTVLIVGLDQREDEPARADTIIILSINEANGDTALVSVPRDSRVDIPGHGQDKINHAMQFGGIALLRQTVAELLDVPLNYYLYTNFAGFESIVDAVGGVEINVERPVPVPGGPALETGPRRLDGREALAYVRFRSDAEGDFGRMRRQRQVLTAIGRRLTQPQSLLRLPILLEQCARHVRTDLTPLQLAKVGRTVRNLDLEQVPAVTLRGEVATIDGISYVLLNKAFLRETVRRYLRWESPSSGTFLAI